MGVFGQKCTASATCNWIKTVDHSILTEQHSLRVRSIDFIPEQEYILEH